MGQNDGCFDSVCISEELYSCCNIVKVVWVFHLGTQAVVDRGSGPVGRQTGQNTSSYVFALGGVPPVASMDENEPLGGWTETRFGQVQIQRVEGVRRGYIGKSDCWWASGSGDHER